LADCTAKRDNLARADIKTGRPFFEANTNPLEKHVFMTEADHVALLIDKCIL
jgi:hypothetical protein